MPPLRFRHAVRAAENLLQKRGLACLPIDPFDIAASLDILVQPKPETAVGVSGMLLWQGTTFGILYATHIDNEGFQRFSVGHELGHYLLAGHLDHLFPSGYGQHRSHAGFVSTNTYELEADYFAAGLLMPEPLFSQAGQSFPVGLAAIKSLASLCRTSLTATAMRYLDTTTAPVAIVVSTGQHIEYSFLSLAMEQIAGVKRPRKGCPLPLDSATSQFNGTPRQITLALETTSMVDLRIWLGGDQELNGVEEVLGLGRYGKTLTILSVSSGVELRRASAI